MMDSQGCIVKPSNNDDEEEEEEDDVDVVVTGTSSFPLKFVFFLLLVLGIPKG